MHLLAQLTIPGPGGETTIVPPSGIPGGELSFGQIASFAIAVLFALAVILSLVFLLWGGLSWTISGGDKEKLDKARKTIIYAIVGLVVVVLAFFLVNFVGDMLGVSLLGKP